MKNILLGSSLISQFLQVLPISIIGGLIYLIIRIRYLEKNNKQIIIRNEILYLIFGCYIIGLISLVLVPNNFWSSVWFYIFNGYSSNIMGSLFSFKFSFKSRLYLYLIGKLKLGPWTKLMILGNVLMFVPMGILLPLIKENIRNKKIIILGILIPLVIELIQPFIGREFDIDDIFLNFMGIILGYIIYKLIIKIEVLIFKKEIK